MFQYGSPEGSHFHSGGLTSDVKKQGHILTFFFFLQRGGGCHDLSGLPPHVLSAERKPMLATGSKVSVAILANLTSETIWDFIHSFLALGITAAHTV